MTIGMMSAMSNLTAMQRHINVIREHLSAPSCPARNAALMLADALRDPHLDRKTKQMTIAALIDYDDAAVIERMCYDRGRV
jgi:1,4-dihydroxy-2-naphthoate octaprenyltransferase